MIETLVYLLMVFIWGAWCFALGFGAGQNYKKELKK